MGKAAYDRGSKAIRQSIEDDNAASKSWRGALTTEKNRADLAEARLESMSNEKDKLEVKLIEVTRQLEAQKQMNAELSGQIEVARLDAQDWRHKYFDKEKAHAKLSAIVRAAISPEKYHEMRAWCAHQFPFLFGDEAKEQN